MSQNRSTGQHCELKEVILLLIILNWATYLVIVWWHCTEAEWTVWPFWLWPGNEMRWWLAAYFSEQVQMQPPASGHPGVIKGCACVWERQVCVWRKNQSFSEYIMLFTMLSVNPPPGIVIGHWEVNFPQVCCWNICRHDKARIALGCWGWTRLSKLFCQVLFVVSRLPVAPCHELHVSVWSVSSSSEVGIFTSHIVWITPKI